jgi:hypothetical protein
VPLPFTDVSVDDQGCQWVALLAEDSAQSGGAVLLHYPGRVLGVQPG